MKSNREYGMLDLVLAIGFLTFLCMLSLCAFVGLGLALWKFLV